VLFKAVNPENSINEETTNVINNVIISLIVNVLNWCTIVASDPTLNDKPKMDLVNPLTLSFILKISKYNLFNYNKNQQYLHLLIKD